MQKKKKKISATLSERYGNMEFIKKLMRKLILCMENISGATFLTARGETDVT